MAAPKRTKAQYERDLTEVAHLYCAGRRQVEIAAKLAVSQQVSYDVQRLLREWRAGHRADIDRYVGETLERINRLEVEYWDAWRRSREPGRRTVEERRRSPPRVADAAPYQVNRVTVEEVRRCDATGPSSRACSGASASAAGSSASADRASDDANDDVCHNPNTVVQVVVEYAKRGYGKDVAHGSGNARQPHLSL